MYEATIELDYTKPLNKDIESITKEVIEELKEKFESRSKSFTYTSSSSKNGLKLNFKSEAQFTATDLLVQFEKQAKMRLGKQLKTGIKEFKIKHYKVMVEIDEKPKKEISVPFVESIDVKGKKCILIYKDLDFKELKDHYVEKTIKLVNNKALMQKYEGKEEAQEIVWEGKQRPVKYEGDPAVDLEKKDWIRRTSAKGQFVYGREFTALVNVLKELYIKHVYKPLNFKEMIFPKFEPWEVPKKSGHAKNIYPTAYFVNSPKDATPEYWEEVMDKFEITGEVDTELVKEKTDNVGIMSYAQCPPFWPYLENKIIDNESLPLLLYDWSGPTYRNESGGTHGLDRIEEFHRIETLWIGTLEEVLDAWKKLKDSFQEFYDEVLDMEIKVSQVAPWWMVHEGKKDLSEDADIGTYDFEAYLPYRGDRDKEWLEIQNVSSNGDKYPKGFQVKGRKSDDYLWSGCAGASFQRVIVAFLAQKGLEEKNWPKEVKELYKEKVEGITPLKLY